MALWSFYDLQGKTWATVQDLSPSKALVLGPTNYLRFVPASSSPKIDKKSHIPDYVVEDLNRHMVELYDDLLNEIDNAKFYLEIRAPSEKLTFKGGSIDASIKTKPKIQFRPKPNFNGNVTYTLHSFLLSPNKSYMAVAQYFSPEVAQALKVVPAKKGKDHPELFGLGKKVLLELLKSGKEPTIANVVQTVKDLKLNASEVKMLSDAIEATLKMFDAPGLKEDFKPNKRVELVKGAVKYNGGVTRVRIVVRPVNDQPVMKRNRADLVPVPYDLNATSYTGTLVKDVFSQSKAKPLVEDVDDKRMDLGVAVLAAGNNTFGKCSTK
ncbi:hypothetical protein OS493_004974 [Desmophyllum pertusum]|uniref:Uncharacterized protein n=1 Tax=Desmophyllum pertusum TaxID=174260 RepID=A0A9W9Z481_9CNID|nr:hypothetical protein OS493_004974 [Desmophyllum pertusum]